MVANLESGVKIIFLYSMAHLEEEEGTLFYSNLFF